MKKIYIFLAAILVNAVNAQVITIGTGASAATGQNYNPIYRSSAASAFDFHRAFFLYDATELAAAGLPAGATITQIEWDKSNTGATVSSTANIVYNIYMNNSAMTSYATAQTWGTLNTGATLVYNNNNQVIPATTGFIPFVLTTPFVYNGGALEISTDWDISAVSGNPTTAGFAFNTSLVTNHVGGNSNSVALNNSTFLNVYGNRPNIKITYTPPSPCSGTPNSGTSTISVSQGCPNTMFNLSATGLSVASALTYQWYSAPSASGPWTAVTNATNTAYSTSVTNTTYYQMVTTCTVSSLSATTSITSYSVVNPGPCICNSYGASSATNIGDEEIFNVTFGTLNSSSQCTTTAPGPGSQNQLYSNYTGFVTAPTVMQGQAVPYSIDIQTCGGWFGVSFDIYIDYNQNGSFLDAGELAATVATATQGVNTGIINIPLTALVGTTRMRVVAVEGTVPGPTGTYGWGETEDYCVDIVATTPCSGTPNSGTSTISLSQGCPNVPFNLTTSGLSVAGGLTYQWYSSSSPTGPWTAITNATNTTHSESVTTTTYYQMVTTCTVSALSATTSVSSYSVVNPGPCVCNPYGSSGATNAFDEEILQVDFHTLSNPSTCTTTAPGPGSVNQLYSNYVGFLAAPSVTQAQTVSFTVNVGTCGGNFNSATAIYIDYNQNGSFADAGEQAFLTSASTLGPHLVTGNITIPLTALVGTTRMRVINWETGTPSIITPTGSYGYGETEDYCVDIVAAPLCSGTPNSGTASINTPTGCPNVNFNLNATGLTAALGIQYQWYSSPSATGPWSAIATATNTSYSSSTTTTTYYQLVTTCTVSSQSATTSVVSYSIINPGPCVCAGYTTSSATSAADEEILNVTFDALNNTSSCASVGPGLGSVQNMYSNYVGFLAAPSVTQAQTVSFTVQVGTCGGNFNNCTAIYIDYNQNGLFTDAGEQVYLSAAATNGPHFETGNITIPLTATPGTTRMRVINVETGTPAAITPTGTYTWGETEDYCVDIVLASLCSGAPNSGTATISSPTACPNSTLTLNATGVTAALAIQYQWYSSPSATGPWSAIPTATNTTYQTSTNTTTYYQMVTTCTASAMDATTSVVSFSVVNPGPCICNNYGASGATSTFDEEIWNTSFGTLNNTSNCTVAAPGPGSQLNLYSNYTGFVAAPQVMQNQNVPYSIDIQTCNGFYGMQFDIYIDYNQNGSFADAGEQVVNNTAAVQGANTGFILIPATAAIGTTRMRVVAVEGVVPGPTGNYTWGETEDYCIDIIAPVPCAGTPNSGTASISTNTGCITSPFNLNATGLTTATGITYQWYSSPSPTGPWTAISTATNPAFASTASVTTFFQMVTTCSNSAQSATTSIVSYTPSNCYIMSNATITACGGTIYDSGGNTGNYTSNEDYTLTILPSATNNSVILTFNTFNTEAGFDYLDIYDGNSTAATLLGSYDGNTLPPVTMATNAGGALTLHFYSDGSVEYSGFDIAVTCTAPCAGPPAGPAITSMSLCSGNSATLTAAASGTAQWYTTPSTSTTPVSTSTVFVTPSLSTNTTYYVTDSTNCGQSTLVAVSVTVAPTPTMILTSSTGSAVCAGQSATLTATSMDTYTWSGSSQTTSPLVVTPSVTTVYTVTGYQAQCNSMQTETISVGVNALPVVTMSASGITTICATNGSIGLQGSPAGGVFSGPAVTGTLLSIANAGTFTPMYSYTNATTGCSNSATVQVIVINCGTGIAANMIADGFNVFPNPNTGTFKIETDNTIEKHITITDLTGRVVWDSTTDSKIVNVDINELANGVYNLRITTKVGTDMVKLIKQ